MTLSTGTRLHTAMKISLVTVLSMLMVLPLVWGTSLLEEEEKVLELLRKALEEAKKTEVQAERRDVPVDYIQGQDIQLTRTEEDAKLCEGKESNCQALQYRITWRKETEPEYLAVEEDAIWGSSGKVHLPLSSSNKYDITVCRVQEDGKLQPCQKIIHAV